MIAGCCVTTRQRFPHASYMVVFLAALAVGACTAFGGQNEWTTNGPEGGVVDAIVIDPLSPDVLYASTWRRGVFKSTNGAGSWKAVNNGLVYDKTGWDRKALAIDPSNPATLYVGTNGGGVFKTTNGGASWKAVNNGLVGNNRYSVNALAIDASHFDSTVAKGFTFISVNALAIDPSDPATVYAAISDTMFKSTNGGGSWKRANKGWSDWQSPWAIAVDPSSSMTVYAGADAGLYKSTNGGRSWKEVLGVPGGGITSFAIDPSDSRVLYAGDYLDGGPLYKTTNGGGSWKELSVEYTDVYVLSADPFSPETVYVGTSRGVFKSTDRGASWAAANRGLTNRTVAALATDPSRPGVVYAGTDGGGVFKSTDGCASWTAVNSGLRSSYAEALLISPSSPMTIYAGTSGESWYEGLEPKSRHGAGVFRSTDGGETWSGASAGLTCSSISCLAADRSDPKTAYAATYGGGVFKSTDGGGTWRAANTGLRNRYVNALAVDPSHPTTLYAGTNTGMSKTTNRGGSWTNGGLGGYVVMAVAVNACKPTTLYAATLNGVYKTSDGGRSWKISLDQWFILSLAIDPSNPSTIYAGTFLSEPEMYKSTDGGASWQAADNGLDSGPWAIAVDPSNPMTVYAGGYGVSRSTDAGASWKPFNTGLTNPQVMALAIDSSNPSRVYAGTRGGGVFSIDITDPEFTWEHGEAQEVPSVGRPVRLHEDCRRLAPPPGSSCSPSNTGGMPAGID